MSYLFNIEVYNAMTMNLIYKSIIDTILKNIDIGINVVDGTGKTIIYNQAMGDMEGLDVNEVMGKSILDIFPSLTPETSTLLTVLKTGKPIYNRYQTYLNNKGKQISTINSTIPIVISPGKHGALEMSKNITKEKELSDKIVYLHQELASKDIDDKNLKGYTFRNLIGEDEKFHSAIDIAKKAAMSSSSVLIYGETGTGKELFAQSIHNESNRKHKPLIAQNCAALPESLLEGILFGTDKGSFTGAINRPGLFEQANGGTLLLDEINSLGLQLQAKLLRVLQEGYVRRVGGLSDIPIDVRILATTNEDLSEILQKGILRKDLYYRLNVISVNIPPLRERKNDIPILIDHFIKKYNSILQKDVWYVSNDVKEAFLRHDWPGNVRELENIIESAINMINTGHIIKPEHVSPDIYNVLFKSVKNKFSLSLNENQPLDRILEEVEKSLILEALQECENNISRSSEKLGIKRQTLQHKLKRYGIKI